MTGAPDRCETCRYAWKVWGHSNAHLECRRHAPRGVTVENYAYRDKAVWPEVGFSEWCGEFKAAEIETVGFR